MKHTLKGFSLAEMMVVMILLGILSGMVYVAMGMFERAKVQRLDRFNFTLEGLPFIEQVQKINRRSDSVKFNSDEIVFYREAQTDRLHFTDSTLVLTFDSNQYLLKIDSSRYRMVSRNHQDGAVASIIVFKGGSTLQSTLIHPKNRLTR